jgi:replicative DNA helicase
LKIIARELNVPVMVLSQLNRSLESRSDKKPILSDLRESGNIEQDADVVLFLYREYVYKQSIENEGKITAIIAKHRNGKSNMEIEFKHNQYLNDFFDIDTGNYEANPTF